MRSIVLPLVQAEEAARRNSQQSLEALRYELAECKADREADTSRCNSLEAALKGEQALVNEYHTKVLVSFPFLIHLLAVHRTLPM